MEYIDDFLNWVDDDSYIADYDDFSFPDFHFLLRVYLYTPPVVEKKGNILGIDGKSASQQRRQVLVPYAKVISKGHVESPFYKDIEPGDIVALTDELVNIELNPKHQQYRELMKERPAPDISELPPKYIGYISRWYQYQFLITKLEDASKRDDVEDLTFCVPQAFLKSKVNRGFFEKYKTTDVVQA